MKMEWSYRPKPRFPYRMTSQFMPLRCMIYVGRGAIDKMKGIANRQNTLLGRKLFISKPRPIGKSSGNQIQDHAVHDRPPKIKKSSRKTSGK